MIIHFANQSQTCQLLKILTRSLYVASFLVIFFFFSRSLYAASFLAIFIIFLLHSRSVSLYTGFFLTICIFTLLRCCSYSLNSGSDLACLFHSALYCCLISLHFDHLYIFSWPCQLNLSVTVNIYQQLPVPLKTCSENQRLQNFYSIIHPYSTCTVSHQDYLIIRYMYICIRYARFFNACFAYRFLICRSIISFTNFIKSLSLLVTFLNFRHGLSIDLSHVHLSIYKRSFYQEFQQISKWCCFGNLLRKVGHIGLSHGCHVIWRRSLIGCLP